VGVPTTVGAAADLYRWADTDEHAPSQTLSTDFIALFDAQQGRAAMDALLVLVESAPPDVAGLVARYGAAWRQKTWALSQATAEEAQAYQLVGPGGFYFRYAPRTLELYHMMPFDVFTHDETAQQTLRRVCARVATVMNSTRAIYTHEMMPYEGESLECKEATLRREIGPPAATFDDLRKAAHFRPGAWIIDDFHDIVVG
jgi:hypothetical protein